MSGSLGNPIRRALLRSKDALKYSSLAEKLLLTGMLLRARFVASKPKQVNLLTRAYRLAKGPRERNSIRKRLAPYLDGASNLIWRENRICWPHYPQAVSQPHLNRSNILKAPQAGGEKGVMILVHEYNWLRLLANEKNVRDLDQQYHFILSTSWSPTDYALLALALQSLRGTIFVQVCHHGEIPMIEQFSPRLKCLPVLLCDWLDPACYPYKPYHEREIDILMVANWAPFKRHWQFFEALRTMPRDLRITMIGMPEGPYTLARVRDQAALFGVKQQIEFVESIPIAEVARYQRNSKMAIILSRREGCCMAVVESLFADSPVAMLAGAHVGPVAYINKQTGVLLKSGGMGRQLQHFLDTAESCRARAWVTEHISCFQSYQKLNTLMRNHSEQQGLPWTKDLKMPCWWDLHPMLVNRADREEMRPVYEDLHKQYPNLFGADFPHPSAYQ
jgi:glycosyltransferase involved in cell wall biosynthesis